MDAAGRPIKGRYPDRESAVNIGTERASHGYGPIAGKFGCSAVAVQLNRQYGMAHRAGAPGSWKSGIAFRHWTRDLAADRPGLSATVRIGRNRGPHGGPRVTLAAYRPWPDQHSAALWQWLPYPTTAFCA